MLPFNHIPRISLQLRTYITLTQTHAASLRFIEIADTLPMLYKKVDGAALIDRTI